RSRATLDAAVALATSQDPQTYSQELQVMMAVLAALARLDGGEPRDFAIQLSGPRAYFGVHAAPLQGPAITGAIGPAIDLHFSALANSEQRVRSEAIEVLGRAGHLSEERAARIKALIAHESVVSIQRRLMWLHARATGKGDKEFLPKLMSELT